MKNLAIYGAKSIALGVYKAVTLLYHDYKVECFLVSSLENNPLSLAGLPVRAVSEYASSVENKEDLHILIGTPQNVQGEIIESLNLYGFCNYTAIDSVKYSSLMEHYYAKIDRFPSLHSLEKNESILKLQVLVAKHCKDKILVNKVEMPTWTKSIQVGTELTDMRIASVCDNTGINISCKNANYCELTALYWLWKNVLVNTDSNIEYTGLYQYRRILDISEDDMKRIMVNDVDAVLPFPMLHEPDIREHHTRYVSESDWNAMIQALEELQPEYVKAFEEVFRQPYFYNYNIIIARNTVLLKYCEWLFPILERVEELSTPKGNERADRYIGYLGENLMTLYFMYNRDGLNIFHTGSLMLV
jgi:hypothetical protein